MKTKSLLLIVFTLFLARGIYAQDFLKYLPKNKKSDTYTLYDYQDAFNTYWAPYHVKNGYYFDKNGHKQKAPYWKVFNRWFYYMEKRVNPTTGAFPTTSAQEQYDIWKRNNSHSSNKGIKAGPLTSSSWTSLGPNSSSGGYFGTGRLNCVAFHPSDNNTFWAGSPSGGLWKTTNGGTNWTVLTDNNAVLGVSDIGIPSDYGTSSTIYIATGDRDGGSMWSLGGGQVHDNNSIGVLKSTDGGSSWAATGLTYTISQGKMLSRILIDPNNLSTIYVAGSDGILKSTDGGSSWTNIYNSYTVVDMEFKPGDPTVIYASTKDYWNNVYALVSTNSGASWTTAATFATDDYRCNLAVSAANSSYVYAVVVTRSGGLKGIYKSTDSGASYSLVYDGTATNHNLMGYYTDGSGGTSGQGGYDLAIAVSPNDINEVYVAGVNTHKSTDGGLSWNAVNCWTSSTTYNKNSAPVAHSDHHMLNFRASDAALFEVNDGGIYNTTDGGSNWTMITGDMVISQMYRISVAQTVAGDLLAGLQDNGTKAKISGTWYTVQGGDGLDCHIDKNDVNNQYGSYSYGHLNRTTAQWSGSETDISPSGKSGTGAWLTPFVIDPNNSNTLYAAYNNVYKSTDQGTNWSVISSMNTTDSRGNGNLRTLAVAPSNSSVIYTADPNTLWKTTDGGSNWSDITGSLPVSTNAITYISVKDDDANTLWVTFGGYDGDRIYQSTDGGSNWSNISSGLPNIPIMCVIQNKLNTGNVELYVGTDVGIYLKDGTNNWTSYMVGLPNVVINDLAIYYDNSTPANSLLYAGSSGRGIWSSPLNSTSCTAPATQASNFATSNLDVNSMTVSWTRGNGDRVIVLAHKDAAVDANPSSGTAYSANMAFGSGDEIGTGNYVVYNGTATSANVNNLNGGTTYYYAVYEYDTTDNCYLMPALVGSATTLGTPSVTTAAVSSITASSATSGGDVTSTNGASLTHKGVCWSTSTSPTIADSYTDDIASGSGTGTYSSSLTSLSNSTTYYVRAYATNANGTAYGNELNFTTSCGGTISVFPYNESFEGTNCWLQGDVTGTSGQWNINTGMLHPSGSAEDGNKVLSFNSYTADEGDQTLIYSPDLDLSSLSKPMFSFWMYHDDGYSSDTDKVQVAYKIGGSWYLSNAIYRYSTTVGWLRYYVDLSSLSGLTNIGFLGTSAFGNDCNIDNVMLFDGATKTNGKLSKCSPYYIRDGGNGSLYFYDEYTFRVADGGNYDIIGDWQVSSSFDGYLYLYSPSFDPANPSTNLIASNDDYNSTDSSKIASQALSAATDYVVVATTFSANNVGSNFVVTVEGNSEMSAPAETDYHGIPGGAYHTVASTDGTSRVSDYECDDSNNWTHYYDDNGTAADYSDDNILLSVKKNSNELGATTVTVAGASGASEISPSVAPYTSSFNGWYVFNRYWKLTPATQPGSDVKVRFYYTSTDFNDLNTALSNAGRSTVASLTDLSFLKINDLNSAGYNPNPADGQVDVPKATAYDADGAWIYSHAASASTDRWASGTLGSANYSEFIVRHFSGGGGGAAGNTYDGSLPIELLKFKAFARTDFNAIEWQTASESNVDYFEVQRLNPDTKEISSVGHIQSKGNSNTLQKYEMLDKKPLEAAYYRLRNVDLDGIDRVYDWVYVQRTAKKLEIVNIYPNPSLTSAYIDILSPKANLALLEIRNSLGQIIYSNSLGLVKGSQTIQVDVSAFEAGVYYLSLSGGGERITTVLLKK